MITSIKIPSNTLSCSTTRLSAICSHLSSPHPFAATMSTSPSIPKTMKGVLIEKTGGVEVLQYRTDLPIPSPKEDQILVKNEFIGINYIDTYPSLFIRYLTLTYSTHP